MSSARSSGSQLLIRIINDMLFVGYIQINSLVTPDYLLATI